MEGRTVAERDDTPPILAGRRGVIVAVSSEESIGFHAAARLHALGASVAIAHRPARREAALRLAERAGAELTVPIEVDDDASIAAAFGEIDRAWGRLDFLVHTVVHVPEGVLAAPLIELRREDFRAVLETAAYSLVALCGRAAPLFAKSLHPRVVAISSACGNRITPHYHVAGIAKAALESALMYLAAELGPKGVLCNAVSPSLLATDGAVRAVGAANAAATRAHLAKKAPTRRPVDYADVSDAVAFLCSTLCRNTTGEVISVDGGYAKNYF
jgi:enoyl-[acyl-carrier protein] reductase I